ncbi:hypothetical protein ACTJJ7_15925 [Phyllobacterium sp. 22229]|uniref:hypothetical protein n=1 Tax=Phyllobacterium sp. 22229 TaxID=3453895 RepID=UPI003F87F0E0
MPVTDTTFEALVDARCESLRPSGYPAAFRECIERAIRNEQKALNWVPADPELIRQCSTDAMLQVAA